MKEDAAALNPLCQTAMELAIFLKKWGMWQDQGIAIYTAGLCFYEDGEEIAVRPGSWLQSAAKRQKSRKSGSEYGDDGNLEIALLMECDGSLLHLLRWGEYLAEIGDLSEEAKRVVLRSPGNNLSAALEFRVEERLCLYDAWDPAEDDCYDEWREASQYPPSFDEWQDACGYADPQGEWGRPGALEFSSREDYAFFLAARAYAVEEGLEENLREAEVRRTMADPAFSEECLADSGPLAAQILAAFDVIFQRHGFGYMLADPGTLIAWKNSIRMGRKF